MNVSAANFSSLKNIILFAALTGFLSSCLVVRDYPLNKPFVYETKINVHGDLKTDEKKDLESKLKQQLHDSVAVRSVQKLAGFDHGPKLFYSVLKNPAVYDSINADKSITFMRALLHSQGYYRDSISYRDTVKVSGDQQRAYITFDVVPGKLFRIDSISININDSSLKQKYPELSGSLDNLQRITMESRDESLIKKGEAFAKPLISAEFDRLTDVYRNNGYLRFSREGLVAVWDTVGLALLRPTIDPVEQAELFEALEKRKQNPVADIELRLRENKDSLHLQQYYVGNVTVYPDVSADTGLYTPAKRRNYKGYQFVTYQNLFRPRVVAENIFLNRGELYDQRKHLKTLNRFNSVGAWRLVNIDTSTRPNSDTVDFTIRLTPALKYLFDQNIEASQNLGGSFTGTNLLGLNFTLQNRNFMRGANQSNTSLGFGTELNARLTQTIQLSAGQSIYFPRMIPRWKILKPSLRQYVRTSLGFNARYVHRVDYLDLLSVNTSWGWDYNRKNYLISLRIPNVEYTFLDKKILLRDLEAKNRSYAYIFNPGLVSSTIFSITKSGGKKDNTVLMRIGFEPSGIFLGMFRSEFLDSNLKRFVKIDASYQLTHKIRRTAIAFRVFGGWGITQPYNNLDTNRFYMPFFKAYFAGGANSMRGWGLRKLGPGSTIKSFARTGADDIAPERFGDMQLEANIEYRFYVADIRGVIINSALFTDIGNIWYLRKNKDFPGGEFAFNKLWKDLAVAMGTGLRVDFGFIKIRLDYAYKAKDPSPDNIVAQNKWFYNFKPLKGTAQIGVDYPF